MGLDDMFGEHSCVAAASFKVQVSQKGRTMCWDRPAPTGSVAKRRRKSWGVDLTGEPPSVRRA